MLQNLSVDKPCTVYIQFSNPLPNLFTLRNSDGEFYFFRHLDGKTPRIKFNIPDPGNYEANHPFKIIKTTGIEIPGKLPTLPPAERSRYKGDPTVVIDENLDELARNYTNDNLIVFGKRWLALPFPLRLFIYLHEKWHFFYMTEEYCDLGALVDFLRMGYNRSTAFYALDHVLTDNAPNRHRIKQLFNNIQKTQKEPLL
jgi:hypothetical protein